MLELGGVAQVQEQVRDVWLTQWLRDFACDLRFSVKSFRRTPSFTITAVLSLMLGVGATTAIYSLVDQVLSHALPVYHPERLVLVWKGEQAANGFGSWNLMSYPICRDLDGKTEFFAGVFCRAAIRLIYQRAATIKRRTWKSSPAITFDARCQACARSASRERR